MTLLGDPSDKKGKDEERRSQYAAFSLLAAIPALLLAGPAIGFFLGSWADKKLGTDPYLVILGIILGFGASGVEIYGLIKKSQAMEDRKDNR